MTDQEVLDAIAEQFGSCRRPEHFTDYQHCCECAEHDTVLRARDLGTVGMDEVGNQAWDPICFITPEGFAYYMPALARLALMAPDPKWGWYGGQLAFHLRYDGRGNVRWQACTLGQRRAVVLLLEHLLDSRTQMADDDGCAEMLLDALTIWSDTARPN